MMLGWQLAGLPPIQRILYGSAVNLQRLGLLPLGQATVLVPVPVPGHAMVDQYDVVSGPLEPEGMADTVARLRDAAPAMEPAVGGDFLTLDLDDDDDEEDDAPWRS